MKGFNFLHKCEKIFHSKKLFSLGRKLVLSNGCEFFVCFKNWFLNRLGECATRLVLSNSLEKILCKKFGFWVSIHF